MEEFNGGWVVLTQMLWLRATGFASAKLMICAEMAHWRKTECHDMVET
jgi:hypothetical protein